jgi:flagellar hook-basal body complex protein FliE
MAPAPIAPVDGITATGYVPAAAGVPRTDGSSFAAVLTSAVDNVQALSGASNELSLKAASGNLDDIHDATIASTRAAVSLELVAAVRNKGVDAFNEIMRMQG